jgi:hypothetical protein
VLEFIPICLGRLRGKKQDDGITDHVGNDEDDQSDPEDDDERMI